MLWVSAVLLTGLVLLFLWSISPAVLGAALGLLLVITIICLLPAKPGEPGGPPREPRKGHYLITGPSPVRQELTLSGTGRCSIYFWFMGNQSMEYRFDVLDGNGDDIPERPWPNGGYPDRTCWCNDEHGPAGNVFVRENAAGWTVTIRYALRATDEKVVRKAELKVEVQPPTAKVQIPENPTPLPEPQMAWGRLDAPSEQLTRPPSVPRDTGASAPGG